MNKILTLAGLALAGVALTGCDDFLNDNRYPLTSIVNTPEYWSNPSNCQLQVDRNIDFMPAYGTGGGQNGWFYFKTLNDDQVGSTFADWAYPTAMPKVDEWDYSWVRGTNYIINGVYGSSMSVSNKANYLAIARLQRAIAYYRLVRMFGDVVWENEPVDPADTEILKGPRTDRDIVMDSVLNDLKFAVEHIAQAKSAQSWSRDLAKAVLSEVALYEGTFCKYRTQADNGKAPDATRAEKFLRECANASEALLASYGFRDDFKSIYNSTWNETDGINGTKITALSANPELIFGREYNSVNGLNSLISFTASSTTTSGMSLDAFKSFLFRDGKPAATTSLDNTLVGVPVGTTGLSIQNLLDVRDARLSCTTDPYVYYQNMTWSRAGTTGMNSSSGFGVAKYDNIDLPVVNRQNSAQNYTSAPLYWTSYIACNYAEAKAELGEFDQAAFNKSLKKLYERAQLPISGPADLSAINDPANNMGVSSLLWEIRRCRRCELMFDNWIRYWDLIRWHQLDKLDNSKYPDVLLGAYMANSPVSIDNKNGYVDGSKGMTRKYDPKYYLYPIPTEQLDLNPELGKNPGW